MKLALGRGGRLRTRPRIAMASSAMKKCEVANDEKAHDIIKESFATAATSVPKHFNHCLFVKTSSLATCATSEGINIKHLPLGSVWYLSCELVICQAFSQSVAELITAGRTGNN